MVKKSIIFAFILIGILFYAAKSNLSAEEGASSSPVVSVGTKTQNVFGVVGKVDYVDFKSRGNSTLVVKDNKGETVKVSLEELKSGATILTTFRKEKNKKGKEENVLISLSIVRTAKETKESGQKK